MKKIIFLTLLALLVLLTSCGQQPVQPPPQSANETRVPYSKGPTSPPHISQPTYPPPP